MGDVIQFRKGPRQPEKVEIPHTLRDYEQCRILQEHAFRMHRYWEIMMVDGDAKRCFLRKCDRSVAEYQITLRNGVPPTQFTP